MDTNVAVSVQSNLRRYLDDLEERIDGQIESELSAQWTAFCFDQIGTGVFDPRRPRANAPGIEWPKVPVNATLDDYDAMLLHQFASCSETLASGSGAPMMVRANYGTPILAIPFGVKLFVMPEETNTLPACHPLDQGPDTLRRIVDAGEPSIDHPYLQRVFETGRRYRAVGAQYPKIGKWVEVYHPDLQGPMDVLDLILGGQLFELLYDEADLVHAALETITRTYIRVMEAWREIVPPRQDGTSGHWGLRYRGSIMLRDDSAMNVSPDMFDEFIRPYDQRLFSHFGGGAMHACGRVEHFIDRISDMRDVRAFNLTQPHLNDMNKCFAATIDRGIPLIGLPRAAARNTGHDLRGRVHVIG